MRKLISNIRRWIAQRDVLRAAEYRHALPRMIASERQAMKDRHARELAEFEAGAVLAEAEADAILKHAIIHRTATYEATA